MIRETWRFYISIESLRIRVKDMIEAFTEQEMMKRFLGKESVTHNIV